jgi:LmbE family N-acetylglucosaminyl deacetylase
VAVLAPHPDDFDAIGVTLRHLHDNGSRIDVAVMSSGANGVDDGFRGAYARQAKALVREEEQRASIRFFGLPGERLTFFRLAENGDGHLAVNAANVERVRAFLVEGCPDLVFLPHGSDPNLAHQRTAGLMRRAAHDAGLSFVACLNRDPKTIAMRVDLFTVYGADGAAWKGELLRLHASQQARNLKARGRGFDERILEMDRDSASAIDRAGECAEVFELERVGEAEPRSRFGVSVA